MRVLFLVALAALTACTARTTNGGVDFDPITDRIGDWEASVQPQNDSGVRGNVVARSAVASAGISITIAGADAGAQHPWHVHRGTCASGGSIVGGAESYPVLQVGQNGVASSSASIAVGLSEDTEYHVNVHQSPTQLGTIIACGNLQS